MGEKEIKIVQFLQLHYGYFVAVAFFLGDMCALPSSPVINANVGHKSTKASPVSPLLLLDARMPGCQCAGMPGCLHPPGRMLFPAVATLAHCSQPRKKCINSHFYVSALDFTLALPPMLLSPADYPRRAIKNT